MTDLHTHSTALSALRGRFQLSADLSFMPIPVMDSDDLREPGPEACDYLVGCPGQLQPGRVVDAELAALLQQFSSPCSIPEAVLIFCAFDTEAAQERLDGFVPIALELLGQAILLPETSED